MLRSTRSYDALVCETGEFRMFCYRSDRDKFVAKMRACGLLVLTGISYL